MIVGFNISAASLSTFKTQLNASSSRVSNAARTGMDNVSSSAFAKVQAAIPRVTGALANSGKITKQGNAFRIKRTISYGDSTTNPRTGRATSSYATIVHEVYNPQHPNSYKFLEKSIRAYGSERFLSELAAAIREAL